ncbi:hypothetical protein BJY00DRAFT_184891 [Aspergillus carlsbadensis]|nr:hypothetical protein BJY00DRAFT_184891 [Aspergillus carlsbadensis]
MPPRSARISIGTRPLFTQRACPNASSTTTPAEQPSEEKTLWFRASNTCHGDHRVTFTTPNFDQSARAALRNYISSYRLQLSATGSGPISTSKETSECARGIASGFTLFPAARNISVRQNIAFLQEKRALRLIIYASVCLRCMRQKTPRI